MIASRASTGDDARVAANRAAWDASAAHHYGNPRWRELVEGFRTPGYSCFDVIATEILDRIGVADRDWRNSVAITAAN